MALNKKKLNGLNRPLSDKMWSHNEIRVITKLPNSEQSYNGKVKTHN
jgi:hypothetical protein